MPVTPTIDSSERRRRIGLRHHLAPAHRAIDCAAAAENLVGIHATDPASVYLGARARVTHLDRETMAEALYEKRSVLRIHGMRRTMFVVPRHVASVINSAVSHALALAERKRLSGWITQAGVVEGDVGRWLSDVEAQTVAALEELGEATANQLTRRVPGLRVQIPFGEGKKWAGKVGVSTRMLFLLAAEGRIIRGRPMGTWLSSMYAWAPMERWIPGGLEHLPAAEARAELVRRWLLAYGPGTLRDIGWWTGMTVGATRNALSAVQAVEVDLDGAAGYALPDDLDGTADAGPWVALLPSLDSTTMGWQERGWYLGDHGPRLFDRNGNAGPTIWVDGHVVGGWAQRSTGEVVTRLMADVGSEAERAIDEEAARISAWLGASRIIPRFRTPTEQELTS